MASDDLLGALYRRAARDPRDMAYGIWAILHKLGATDLPEPTYDTDSGRQIPLLYRQLTTHLIQVTGNLRILNIAAARRLQGTPSWIPDWSTFESNTWRDVPGFPGTNLKGINQATSPEVKERFGKERARQRISINASQSILTVLARDIGSICDCASFRLTGKDFKVDERNAHLENLRAMLQWVKWAQKIGCVIFAAFYTQPFGRGPQELMPVSAAATWPSPKDRVKWAKLLCKPQDDRLGAYLTRLSDGFRVPRWFRKFFVTQICLCNLIAEMKRKICFASISDQPGKFYLLSCSEETQFEDQVIWVCGLPGPIVVRKRGALDNSVLIISPTSRHGQEVTKKSRNPSEGIGISPLESQFVEYHIH